MAYGSSPTWRTNCQRRLAAKLQFEMFAPILTHFWENLNREAVNFLRRAFHLGLDEV
jgi:hypothetical protein